MSHPANAWQNDPVQVVKIQQMQEDFSWAEEHYSELDGRYHGEYIAVLRKQVVGHHADLKQLMEQAAREGLPVEDLAVMEFPAFFEAPH